MNITEHLLTCLIEECTEIAKDGTKSLRFGLNDRNVLNPTGPTNQERLLEEINDLYGVIELLEEHGILPRYHYDEKKVAAKKAKVTEFMEYARSVGALDHTV